MTAKAEQGIDIRRIIHSKSPLKEETPDAIETIVVSTKRFEQILAGNIFVARYKDITDRQYYDQLEIGQNLANALMPGYYDNVLRESLTPAQYQRALRANKEGKLLKFARAKR